MAAVDARLVNALAILDGVASEGHDAVQSHPDTSTKAIAALEGVIREHLGAHPSPPVPAGCPIIVGSQLLDASRASASVMKRTLSTEISNVPELSISAG